MSRAKYIQRKAESIVELVLQGHSSAVTAFAAHLDETGELTSAIEHLTPDTTVKQMVAAYIKPATGQRALDEWARETAENQLWEQEQVLASLLYA